MSDVKTITTVKELKPAYAGSYYTISGVGGDIDEWVEGYEKYLADEGIGKPTAWLYTTGAAVNLFAGETHDPYPLDVGVLLFPLDGLDMSKLPLFKIRMQDRWFDDVISNMRNR